MAEGMAVVLEMVKGAGAIVLWLGIGAIVIIFAFIIGKKRKEAQAFYNNYFEVFIRMDSVLYR